MTHRLCIVVELGLAGDEGQISPKSRCGSLLIVPKELLWGWPAQTPHLGCRQTCLHNYWLVWNGCSSEAVNWDLALSPWDTPAGHISSLNLPPSRTVLMKGKHIPCSFLLFDSVPCRPGMQPAKQNRELAARAIFNWGLLSCHGFTSLGNIFEID